MGEQMIKTVMVPKEIDFGFVGVSVAVRYGDDDMPHDFPGRKGDMWHATIDIDEGVIRDWPAGISGEFEMKVCDQGEYRLLDREFNVVKHLLDSYVPNTLIPGEYGDYIHLKINEFGVITNWPANPDISDFFPVMEDCL